MIKECKLIQRLAAVALSIMMVCVFMPSVAFATPAEDDALEASKSELEKAKAAESAAKKAMDDAFKAKPEEAKKAYEESKKTYDNAKSKYDSTVKTSDAKSREVDAAKKQKTDIDKKITDLTKKKDAAHKKVTSLPKEIEESEKAVTDAQAASDAAGREFINKKINENKGKDLDAMIEACKGSENTTVAQIAGSEDFGKLVNRGCSYDNLKKSIAYIKKANEQRATGENKSGELKVSYQLMGTAIISGAIDVYKTGGSLLKSNKDSAFWKSGNSKTSAENLAYSKSAVTAAAKDEAAKEWDPIQTWCVDEKKAGKTDHYKTLTDKKYKATGFAYMDGTDYKVGEYPCVAVQEFNDDTTASVTIADFEKELETFFEPYLKPLNDARSKQKDLEKELEKAKKTEKEKAASIKTRKGELKKATSTLTKKQKELKKADRAKADAKKAMDKARNNMDNCESLSKKAMSLDADKPDTYKDFADLKKLVDAYARAKENTAAKQ